MLKEVFSALNPCISLLKQSVIEGENPVFDMDHQCFCDAPSKSRVVWECSSKTGGKFHLKLNIGERPIVNKYREGKMKRTLERELNSS